MRIFLIYIFTLLSIYTIYSQDTIRLEKKPKIILKSWYPEFKDFPTLKINETKILFITYPEYRKTILHNKKINLKTTNAVIEIEETDKPNQYMVKVLKTESDYIEFELWLELAKSTIIIKENNTWKNATELYPSKDDRIMIQKIKLKIVK